LKVLETISESKEAFHKEFPFVIPAIYRRVADELLVELHLLSHQKEFLLDNVFCVGLNKIFTELTEGYQPQKHIDKLFCALCNATGFDSSEIKKVAEETTEKAKNTKLIEIIQKGIDSDSNLSELHDIFNSEKGTDSKRYYSRISAIGILSIVDSSIAEASDKDSNINESYRLIAKAIGLDEDRIEKDISLYKTNKEKLNQAIIILKENIDREKKKLSK
tara:strand:+ start:611 stop:1267 length:657 start_codon:yes stop_codon:yes gene_type:complete